MTITIKEENPHSALSARLISELSNELGKRYGDDGTAAFTPDDVAIAKAVFIVAWLDDQAVGCGALRPHNDNTAEIKRMYVARNARRKGIAQKLLSALEDAARKFGYKRIILETGTRQPEAIGLYQKASYQEMDCYGQYIDDPLSICYEKWLK